MRTCDVPFYETPNNYIHCYLLYIIEPGMIGHGLGSIGFELLEFLVLRVKKKKEEMLSKKIKNR